MVQFRNSVLAVASVIAVQAATINTPSSLTECIPARLSELPLSGSCHFLVHASPVWPSEKHAPPK